MKITAMVHTYDNTGFRLSDKQPDIGNGEYFCLDIGDKIGDFICPDLTIFLSPQKVQELKDVLCQESNL